MLNIVVGGFFGDEGKGKMTGYFAKHHPYHVAARVGGGPQAGHTVEEGKYVCQIPSGFINPDLELYIGRGVVINPETVLKEIDKYDVGDRIHMDRSCTIITEEDILEEKSDLVGRIGSVGTGVGPARKRRLDRTAKTAEDHSDLKQYTTNVGKRIYEDVFTGKNVLVEGAQAYGLDLMNNDYYPYVTTQVTTASQFCSDLGIGPKLVNDVYTIFKSYVTRVAAGKLENEWSEEKIKERGLQEFGTISGRPRRVGDFDKKMAINAVRDNTSNTAVITCIDKLFDGNNGITRYEDLTKDAREFIEEIELDIREGCSHYFKGVGMISTGPNADDVIDRSLWKDAEF